MLSSFLFSIVLIVFWKNLFFELVFRKRYEGIWFLAKKCINKRERSSLLKLRRISWIQYFSCFFKSNILWDAETESIKNKIIIKEKSCWWFMVIFYENFLKFFYVYKVSWLISEAFSTDFPRQTNIPFHYSQPLSMESTQISIFE